MFSTKSGAAKLSLVVVAGLVGLKLAVAVLTGSISILAQTADSFLDIIAVIITFFAVGIAVRPADEEHPFGHGKAEDIAAVIQAVLIFIAGGLIVFSTIRCLLTGATLELTEAGMGVMLVSIIVSVFLSRHLLKVSRATESVALEANACNIAADVYSAVGVLLGLLVIRFTGLVILDPIIAIAVALFILKAAYDVLRGSFGGLVDARLPQPEEEVIRSCFAECGYQLAGFHDLRTRKAGSQRYIELHLMMPGNVSVEESHGVCDRLERSIKDRLANVTITIHVEPCQNECDLCYCVSCTIRNKND